MESPLLLAFIGFAFLLAGFVKGVIGLGLPTISIGLLALTMTPARAAALLVIPSLVTNLWQMAIGPGLRALVRRLWRMLAGIVAGTLFGAELQRFANADAATVALGVALLVYGLYGFARRRIVVPERTELWLSPVIGLATGAITAATGVFVIPAVPYLQALDFDKDELVQALGVSFMVSTVALAAVLWRGGALHGPAAWLSLFALAPALVGMLAGQWLRGRIPAETFRRVFFVGMLLLGAHLALRGIW